jgi:hypothetical protein
MVRLAEVGRTNREHRLAVRSEKRACKTRGIGPVERDLASKEPASVEGIGHVEGARTRTGSGAWVGGNQHVPNALVSCGVESAHEARPSSFSKSDEATTRQKAFRSAHSRALYRARGEASWWSWSTRRHAESQDDACARSGRAVLMEPRERAWVTTRSARDRSRFERGSSSASSSARRVGGNESILTKEFQALDAPSERS